MQSDDPELKAVENRLAALVKCVLAKAEADAEFAGQLKELLLSDALRVTVRSKGRKKNSQEIFDPVAYLSQHSTETLRRCLAELPTSELSLIARKQRLAPPKIIKGMEREDLILKLVTHAQRRLGQGGVFFEAGKPERLQSSSPPPDTNPDSRTTVGDA